MTKATGTTTNSGSAAADSTPADAAPPARTRKPRGPNKPKPEPKISVRTDAVISQEHIGELLAEYVGKMLGKETAEGMELQIDLGDGDGWEAPDRVSVRFATKGSK